MTSIQLEDHEWRALYRILRDFHERNGWIDQPGSTAEPSLLAEYAVAKRITACDT